MLSLSPAMGCSWMRFSNAQNAGQVPWRKSSKRKRVSILPYKNSALSLEFKRPEVHSRKRPFCPGQLIFMRREVIFNVPSDTS